MRCMFLLGSGISIPAGMPGVAAITQQVIAGTDVRMHTAKNFVIRREPGEPCDTVRRVLALVSDLRRLATDYFDREPTYEEIALLTGQVRDALRGEYESAGLLPLVRQLVQRPYVEDRQGLLELSGSAHDYIADTVREMLLKQPGCLGHLDVIVESCRQLGRVDLATLNHDCILEQALEAAGIQCADGFEQTDEDVARWSDDWGEQRVRLLKLHGSIDWWDYTFPAEPWRRWITCRFRGVDSTYPCRPGVDGYPRDLRPVFLTGTFDKILAYETSVFADQHLRFHEATRQTQRLFVIGYGFGDKAINTRLINWLARSRENKLVACHEEPDRLALRARGAIKHHWESWRAGGQLEVVPAHVQDLKFDAIEPHLVL